ncbi:unnamed protein product [Rotaria sordida]|uniref:Uncharacterized protein n=3 Tax=Rotaria sordida TaxID=392033 RepID=A0A814PKB2_9BILA|nr:unnamed protein product [Rotaria sordida]
MLRYLTCLLVFIIGNNGETIYKESHECPGGLAWNKRGKTVIGNGMGSGPDQLYLPNGIFIEPKTHILYIADMSNSRIQKRYPNGDIKTAAGQANGTSGKAPNMLSGPADIFADENENIFIADWGNQRIQFWQKDANSGKTVAGNGSCGPALNEFNFPSTVFFDSKKNIIVSDYKNQRVTQWPFSFDPKTSIGTIIAGGNGAGLNPYQLNGPTGLYYDEKNQILYISNEQSHSITQWVLGDYEPRNIYAGIPGRPGNSAAQLFFPEGLTLDKYGNLYVADTSNHRIQMVCPDAILGITIAGTGQLGNSSSELSYPADIAFDSDLNLYVSDRYNNRIQNDFSPDVNDYNAYGLKIAANNLIIVEAQNDLDWFNIQLAPYTDDVTKNDERGCFFGYNDSSWYVYTIALGKNQSTYSFFFVGEMIGLDEDEKLPNRTFVGFINYNGSLDAIDCDDFILVKTYVTGAFTHQEQLVMTTDPLGSVAYGFSDLFTFSYTASTNNLTVQQNNSPSPSTPFLPYAVDYDGSHGIIAGFLKNDQNSRIKYNTTVILFTIDVSTAAVTPIISWRYPMNGTTWQAGQTNAGADKNDPKFDILITVQFTLPNSYTIGGVRIGLSAPGKNKSSTAILQDLGFSQTFNQSGGILGQDVRITLQLTKVINNTNPLITGDDEALSGIWIGSFLVNYDESFMTNTSYLNAPPKTSTNLTLTISETPYYILNEQSPIARLPEIIYHDFLYITMIIGMFVLIFVIAEVMILPCVSWLILKCRRNAGDKYRTDSTRQSVSSHNNAENSTSHSNRQESREHMYDFAIVNNVTSLQRQQYTLNQYANRIEDDSQQLPTM